MQAINAHNAKGTLGALKHQLSTVPRGCILVPHFARFESPRGQRRPHLGLPTQISDLQVPGSTHLFATAGPTQKSPHLPPTCTPKITAFPLQTPIYLQALLMHIWGLTHPRPSNLFPSPFPALGDARLCPSSSPAHLSMDAHTDVAAPARDPPRPPLPPTWPAFLEDPLGSFCHPFSGAPNLSSGWKPASRISLLLAGTEPKPSSEHVIG